MGPISPGHALVIDTAGVHRMNSVGVKLWIEYFRSLAAREVPLIFIQCSPVIVEQINLISNFTAGGIVESILLHVACPRCGLDAVRVAKRADFPEPALAIPEFLCPGCGVPMGLDDDPVEYLAFMRRR